MKKIVIAAVLALSVQANAKSVKLESIGAALSTRLVAGIQKYIPAAKNSEHAAVEVSGGVVRLKIFDVPKCENKNTVCEELAIIVHETAWPLISVDKFKCGKASNGRAVYGVRYEAETPNYVFNEFYEKITVIDNSSCPKSDRGVGYVTLSVEGQKGPAMMQFFIDEVFKTNP